jgi:monofunctional biosynthetic peptidoglycan transglycosylase
MFLIRMLKSFMSATGLVVFLVVAGIVAWFVPWGPALHLGFLAYFPYEKDGSARFLRVVGPVPGVFSADAWVSGDNIPMACKTALVGSEDTRFFEHSGVDFQSMRESYKYNQKRKKIRRGGSTITQQLVKNAFLSRDKSYVRKARELVGAMLLDFVMSKDSQLNWYLNIVEFGPRVYGLQQAAKYYFKKNARELSASQCISLVAVLPSPTKWGAPLGRKTFTGFLQSRYRTILSRMILMGLTPTREVAFARSHSPFSGGVLPAQAIPAVREAAQDGVAAAEAFEDASDADVVAEQRAAEELPKVPPLLGEGGVDSESVGNQNSDNNSGSTEGSSLENQSENLDASGASKNAAPESDAVRPPSKSAE